MRMKKRHGAQRIVVQVRSIRTITTPQPIIMLLSGAINILHGQATKTRERPASYLIHQAVSYEYEYDLV